MRAFCIDRLVDPRTHKTVAAYGWVQERIEFPKKFWVSIEANPHEFFVREDAAKFFYDHSIVRLMVAMHVNGTSNGHKQSKRRPPINRGPRKRA